MRKIGVLGFAILLLMTVENATQAKVVEFNEEGIAQVDGKPFFPVALFTYDLTSQVMAEMHELRFNTIINGFELNQLDYIHQHGLMAICHTGQDWLDGAKDHPALLAWYLTDEPESHGKTPESEKERYLALKKFDPNHPIGLCHFLFESLSVYKDACDFTMTDVYPITANRDVPIINVGIHIDEARRVHGINWPNWTYIQIFGGPETDGGKWAQPLPHEVRCMAFIALVHRATGILYFSYWPKAPRTWTAVGELNKDIHRIIPWLVAPGKEMPTESSDAALQVRCRRTEKGGIVIAVNTSASFMDAEVRVPGIGSERLKTPLANTKELRTSKDTLKDRFAPFEARVYTWGEEPEVELAATQ